MLIKYIINSGLQYYGSNTPHTLAQVPMLGKNLSVIPEKGGVVGWGNCGILSIASIMLLYVD